MNVKVNGEPKELPDAISLEEAVGTLCANPRGVVVELNGTVIKKDLWNGKSLKENDVLELISFMGGG